MLIERILDQRRQHKFAVRIGIAQLKTAVLEFDKSRDDLGKRRICAENLVDAFKNLQNIDKRAYKAAELIYEYERFELRNILGIEI